MWDPIRPEKWNQKDTSGSVDPVQENAHEARPQPSFPGPESGFTCCVDKFSQLYFVLANWPSVRIVTVSTGSVRIRPSREPETEVEKVKRKWLCQVLKCLQSSISKFSYCVQMCVCMILITCISLPISKFFLRCGSTQDGNNHPNAGPVLGVEKCWKRCRGQRASSVLEDLV